MVEDPPDAPTLVCLAGLLCDGAIWDGALEAMGIAGNAKVLSFGGMSSITAMANSVLSASPERFILAGHSMGGRVALEVCRLAPERVMGLALLNTGVHPPAEHEARSRGELVTLARVEGMRALAERWLPPMLGTQPTADDPVVARLTRMIEKFTPDSFAAQVTALLNRPNAADVLASIRVPVLLLSGTADRWSPPEQHAAMQELCPGSKLVVIQDAGHMSLVEQPRSVAAALASWLKEMGHRFTTIDPAAPAVPAKEYDELAIAHACTQLIFRFARHNDRGEWESASALFTEHATFYRPSQPDQAIRGRAQILAAFKARPPRLTRHVVSNVEVTVDTARSARAFSSIVLYGGALANGTPTIATTSIGHFEDTFERIGDQWLFTQRRGSIVMHSPTVL
jgi:pimeloyl-ACP methyl ester carboxylesterase